MIEQHEAMAVLLEACPSFEEAWHEHVRDYGNDLLYVAAGDFAAHLLSLFQAKDASSFPAVGAAIERLHVEGSPWVREFVTIGVLEGIQNVWSNATTDPEHFRYFLGQESRKWWEGLNNFWSGKVPIVRAEG
jgi:hypothetical protein